MHKTKILVKLLMKLEEKFIQFLILPWFLNLWICESLTYVSITRKNYRLFLDCSNHPCKVSTVSATQRPLAFPPGRGGWVFRTFRPSLPWVGLWTVLCLPSSLLLSPFLIISSKDREHWWLILKSWTMLYNRRKESFRNKK